MLYETISVIGLGYIGLPTAAMFAAQRKKVIGVDVSKDVVEIVNRGEIHIVEPDLDVIVQRAVANGYLRATLIPEASDAFLIAVPTPFQSSGDGEIPQPDLIYVKSACIAIAPVLKSGDLVVLESTSPVGTTEKVVAWLAKERPDLSFPQNKTDLCDIRVAYCPERVLPGQVVHELVENDRVIGGITVMCSQAAVDLYKVFVRGECVITNAHTAEMVKLTENSCRDVQIAFANELSVICEEVDIDVWELIRIANRHPRINILQPGPGVGGHCIAVDPWFIISRTPESAKLIHTARKINDAKPIWVIDKIKIAISDFLQRNSNKSIEDVTIAFYGLAFKPDIDDLRGSPAVDIVEAMCAYHPGNLVVIEPNVLILPRSLSSVELVSIDEAHKESDIHVLLVNHRGFSDLKPRNGIVIDTKGIWGGE